MPLGKEVGLGPGDIVLDGDPMGTQPPQQPLPTFRVMSIVAKRSPISAAAELLLYVLLIYCYGSTHFTKLTKLSAFGVHYIFSIASCNWLFGGCVQSTEERRVVSIAIKVSHGRDVGPKLCDH